MRMFWGNTNRRKGPSPVLTQPSEYILSSAYTSDAELDSQLDMTAHDAECSLLQITRERPVTAEGPHAPSRPSLDEILADRSPAPWTLKAFTAYCAHNMCSENLNFIIDARSYEKLHSSWRADYPTDDVESSKDARFFELNSKWKRILREYIVPNGLQEVNLLAAVRNQLINIPETKVPPLPEVLYPAARQIRALIEDSILLSFLNDTLPANNSDENAVPRGAIQIEPAIRSRNNASQAPSRSVGSGFTYSQPSTTSSNPNNARPRRMQAPQSGSTHSSNRPAGLFPPKELHGSSGSGKASVDNVVLLTDDGLLTPNSGQLSTTPPHTPQRRMSPWSRNDTTWKKLSSKLGLKKRPSGQLLRTGEQAVEEDEDEDD